ncbi:MAG TPA: UDP-N-acetylmuramate--L-alanine ligase [Blastocatellia bacterium]|jgi:UDP-N-acetylmuramate--alanine ligase|nr:UDP-N-acetylmuramate--L-alanine ligase [Blastocatellia bacterium]
MLFRGVRHIHFVGIGGIGMSGIAEVLLSLGENFLVTGSDLKRSSITDRLQSMGGTIFEGHSAHNVAGANVVVCSSAVRPDNPEVVEARARQIPVIPRAEMLAELMRLYRHGIAVAGTHGKTTTTSMLAHLMTFAGFDPAVVVGGRVASLGGNARVGGGEYIVVEADESDGSLLQLTPTIAVLTNIDSDHLDFFSGGIEQIKQCFTTFVNRVPFYGTIVLCLDDQNVQAIIPDVARRTVSYGLAAQADVSAWQIQADSNFETEFSVRAFGHEMGQMKLAVPGLHNVYNALATIAVGLDLNIKFEEIAGALREFRGAERRFQIKGEKGGVLVVDDYGHHPTEIKTTLDAARTSGRRVVTLFQPHRYTRTRDLLDDFARSFYGADVLLVSDIYAASEDPIEGINSRVLVDAMKRFGHRDVEYVGGLANAPARIKEVVEVGDLVLTLGAGNVWQAGEEFLKMLE